MRYTSESFFQLPRKSYQLINSNHTFKMLDKVVFEFISTIIHS